jgi:hypothetical protein
MGRVRVLQHQGKAVLGNPRLKRLAMMEESHARNSEGGCAYCLECRGVGGSISLLRVQLTDICKRLSNLERRMSMKGFVKLGAVAFMSAMLVSGVINVSAQGGLQGGGGAHFIQHFDRDGDGRVSQEEFPGPDEDFADLDEDGDGYIDESEAPSPPTPPSFVDRFDLNGDGKVSQKEFLDHFNRLDVNGDGYIDESEAPQPPPRRN